MNAFVTHFSTLKSRQNGYHLADDIGKCIFLNEDRYILIKLALPLIPWGPY